MSIGEQMQRWRDSSSERMDEAWTGLGVVAVGLRIGQWGADGAVGVGLAGGGMYFFILFSLAREEFGAGGDGWARWKLIWGGGGM